MNINPMDNNFVLFQKGLNGSSSKEGKFSLQNQYGRAIADIESEDELPGSKLT